MRRVAGSLLEAERGHSSAPMYILDFKYEVDVLPVIGVSKRRLKRVAGSVSPDDQQLPAHEIRDGGIQIENYLTSVGETSQVDQPVLGEALG